MATNQALQRLAARPPIDLNDTGEVVESEDDLLADALGAPATQAAASEPLPAELVEVETKDDSAALAATGALQGPLQGDPAKGGALSQPGVKPAASPAPKKKAEPARKPAPAASKPTDKKQDKAQTEKAYISPRPPAFWRRHKVGMRITKGADGLRLMTMVTSNSYQDRETEAVATKALKEYVDNAWTRVEGKCLPDNVLQFWHGGDIGDTVWCDMEGPFLLEVHKERPNKRINVARKGRPPVFVMVKDVWDYLEENPDGIDWGASHGFEFFKRHKSADKTYQRIYKFESSVLPLQWAANPYTFSGVVDMEPREKLLNQLVGERTGKAFRKGARALDKVLAARGLQHKERKATTEKGLLEDMSGKLDGVLAKLTDDPGKLAEIKAAIMGMLPAEAEVEEEVEVEDDPMVTDGVEEDAEAGYRYASFDDDDDTEDGDDDDTGMSRKGLKLLDTLIETQEGLYEGVREIAVRQKALEPLINLPGNFAAMDKRMKALEVQLKMRPQAASESDDSEYNDPDLLANVEKAMAQFDPFFGVHVKAE